MISAINITALDDPIAIVHIPIHLAESVSTTMYWTVDSAPGLSNEFFNVTSNAVEIAVFARTDLINRYWADPADGEIKISSTWRVFEISSGDQGETNNYDSPHLRHVSAPLSRAGISILYQSSYFTDFLLVKESTFKRASEIFAEQGWHVDPSVPSTRRRSQLLSPTAPMSRSSPSLTPLPPTPALTVLPSPLACVGFSHSIERATAERVRQLVVWPEMARNSWKRKRISTDSSALEDRGRPFISYTRTVDGASIVTETMILRWMFGRKNHDRLGGDKGSADEATGYESVMEGTEFQLGGQLAAGYVTDTTDLEDTDDEDDQRSMVANPDATGPRGGKYQNGGVQHSSSGTTTPASLHGFNLDSSHSSTAGPHTPPLDEERRTKHFSLPTTPRDDRDEGAMPQSIAISWFNHSKGRRSTVSFRSDNSDRGRSWNKGQGSRRSSRSDTDGEGQGASVDGMNAGKEKRIGRKRCLQLDLSGLNDHDDDGGENVVPPQSDDSQETATTSSALEALSPERDPVTSPTPTGEIYHLEKSGLVTTFSNLLNSARIRMLYSSTFHTANILVEARDVHRARRLLQGKAGGARPENGEKEGLTG